MSMSDERLSHPQRSPGRPDHDYRWPLREARDVKTALLSGEVP